MALGLGIHSSRTLKRQQCIAVWVGNSKRENKVKRSDLLSWVSRLSNYKHTWPGEEVKPNGVYKCFDSESKGCPKGQKPQTAHDGVDVSLGGRMSYSSTQ